MSKYNVPCCNEDQARTCPGGCLLVAVTARLAAAALRLRHAGGLITQLQDRGDRCYETLRTSSHRFTAVAAGSSDFRTGLESKSLKLPAGCRPPMIPPHIASTVKCPVGPHSPTKR